MPTSDNKRIAKNTVLLYIRMLLSIVVSLYTSRVVLQTLGVEDYGIYNVVGGVVAMFGFLNASMSGATSRFLTFEMGRGDFEKLRDTFSSALIIHIGIALVVLVIAETVGIWFLSNKLVIPEERMFAAHVVYQLSIVSMMVGVTQVPYNACIIAHEKMDVYAYVELLNVFLKLGIVYLLLIGNFDKLILYAVLMLLVSVIVAFTYRIYCLQHYKEAHFRRFFNKEIAKGLLSFSSYNLFGNLASVANLQGTNFVINMFFGVVFNAAASIATTVSGVVTGFASNIMLAFRPQITKTYAAGNHAEFQRLILWAIKAILLAYAFIAIPVGLLAHDILDIWLVEVPDYTVVFVKLLLISIYFETLRYIIIMGIHATGRVKGVSLSTGFFLLLNPFIVYIFFRMSKSAAYSYISIIFVNVILSMIDVWLLKRYAKLISLRKVLLDIMHVTGTILLAVVIMYFLLNYRIQMTIANIIIFSAFSTCILAMLSYSICLNKEQRSIIKNKVKQKLYHS